MIRAIKKGLSLAMVLAMTLTLTACGNTSSEARVDGPDGGSYKIPEPITVIKNDVNDGVKPWDGTTKKETYHGSDYDVTFSLDDTWPGGFNAKIIVENTGKMDIDDWALTFNYPDDLSNVWNVEVKKAGSDGYTFRSLDWNSLIAVGASAEIGMTVQTDFAGFPSVYQLSGDRIKPGSKNNQSGQNANNNQNNGTSDVSEDDDDVVDDIDDAAITKGAQFKKHGKLKVKGRYIVDKKNKAYRIKGVSTHGIAWFPEYVNKSAFNSFRKWGCNTVRLACYSSQGEGYNTTSCWKTIDKGVKAATELGMYVIIDWHILNENNPLMTTANAKKFFKHFGKKYGKRKNVIWEICNEPNGCEWKDVKKYAKKIIPVIRKYSDNIIVVGTPTWSQDVDTAANSRLTGKYAKNVCYTIHFYAATHKDNIREKVKYAFKKKLPVLCTEFSICDASGNGSLDKSSANTWMKLFKKYKIGYNTWSLCNKAESSALIKSSCQKKGKFKKSDLSAAGKWFVGALKKY